jgi:hypothetical protein
MSFVTCIGLCREYNQTCADTVNSHSVCEPSLVQPFGRPLERPRQIPAVQTVRVGLRLAARCSSERQVLDCASSETQSVLYGGQFDFILDFSSVLSALLVSHSFTAAMSRKM